MTKRPNRKNEQRRSKKNRPRRLALNLSTEALAAHFDEIRYGCYGKHKANPYLYGVDPYRGPDSDRSLCDEHAGFTKTDIQRIDALFERAKMAGLVGNLMWTVDDTGWIYELQITNQEQNEWHGYPLLTGDVFALQVWKRFSAWANEHGSSVDRSAAKNAALLYGIKS